MWSSTRTSERNKNAVNRNEVLFETTYTEVHDDPSSRGNHHFYTPRLMASVKRPANCILKNTHVKKKYLQVQHAIIRITIAEEHVVTKSCFVMKFRFFFNRNFTNVFCIDA